MDDISFYLEAILFASPSPLSENRLAELLESGIGAKSEKGQIPGTIERLNKKYEEAGTAFRIHSWAGGFQFATVRDADDAIRPLFEESGERKMSRALIETLAVVAYQQPVTKPELDNIRGVDSTYGVRKLLDAGFITIAGRGEGVGQPLLYGTTQRFLEDFGIDALADLPKIKEVEDILRDPEFSEQAETIHETMLAVESDKTAEALAAAKLSEGIETGEGAVLIKDGDSETNGVETEVTNEDQSLDQEDPSEESQAD